MSDRGRQVMAAVGVLIGLGGAGTLAWNEYRLARQLDAVSTARASLADGGSVATQPVVHVVGKASAGAAVSDPAFALTVTALRLDRTAETYHTKRPSC
jgi:hypothetical protein